MKHSRPKIRVIVLLLTANLIGQLNYAQEKACDIQILNNTESEIYIRNYATNFVNLPNRQRNRHTEWIWLPKSYFLFIEAFFNQHADYKGIWLRFAVFNRNIDPNQQTHRKQIMLQLMPADNHMAPRPAVFGTFNQSVDFLKDPNNTRVEISGREPKGATSFIGPEHIITTPTRLSEKYIKRYNRRFRFMSKRHTTAMFLCQQNFKELAGFFHDKSRADYDGVRISFAHYNSMTYANDTHQERADQITLILTPTKKKQPDFDALYDYYSKKIKLKTIRDDNYNHGELCPSRCPPKDNKDPNP